MSTAKRLKKSPEDVLVDEIVERASAYRHHPKFRRAVVEAKNLVLNYLYDCRKLYPEHWIDPISTERLEQLDKDLIERIANAIHSARIERGY